MTGKKTAALFAVVLTPASASAQTVMVSDAPPQYSEGLVEGLASRLGAFSLVEDRLSRIKTNVSVGGRPDGVLARLDAMSGPEGWPSGAIDPDTLDLITQWQSMIDQSARMVSLIDGSALDVAEHPLEWSSFEDVASETSAFANEHGGSLFFEAAQEPGFVTREFHEAFPLVQISGGFFASF